MDGRSQILNMGRRQKTIRETRVILFAVLVSVTFTVRLCPCRVSHTLESHEFHGMEKNLMCWTLYVVNYGWTDILFMHFAPEFFFYFFD